MARRGLYRTAKRGGGPPGDTTRVLLAEWEGLPAGTEVVPLSGGYDNVANYSYQKIVVTSGPRRGETVRGRA